MLLCDSNAESIACGWAGDVPGGNFDAESTADNVN